MTLQFAANTLIVQLSQTIGSVTFTGTAVANGTNTANVTTPPFGLILVTNKDATSANYLLQKDSIPIQAYKTYSITGPSNSGIISIVDPDGQTVATFKQ